MNLYQKWMSLPAKVRIYVAGSTFVFALLGDHIATKVNEEVQGQKAIEEELKKSP